jgi:hypothetical protein
MSKENSSGGEEAYHTLDSISVDPTDVLASSSNDNGDVAGFTGHLLATSAGAVSVSENAPNDASATLPPPRIFKPETDDDTPKTFPQIVSFFTRRG